MFFTDHLKVLWNGQNTDRGDDSDFAHCSQHGTWHLADLKKKDAVFAPAFIPQ